MLVIVVGEDHDFYFICYSAYVCFTTEFTSDMVSIIVVKVRAKRMEVSEVLENKLKTEGRLGYTVFDSYILFRTEDTSPMHKKMYPFSMIFVQLFLRD